MTSPSSTPLDEDGDAISRMVMRSWDELFEKSRPDVEFFQLSAVRQRIDELVPSVRQLFNQMNGAGITRIERLEDVVPLLFSPAAYKSYPMSLIEKRRFGPLTSWLGGLTTVDLSGVDASACQSVDEWLDLIEQRTGLRPYHTSGTSGKISLIPRSVLEDYLYGYSYFKAFEGFADEPGIHVLRDQHKLPCITPSPRHGRYAAQRMIRFYRDHIAPSETENYTLNEGTVSADMILLVGRVRMAQAAGTTGDLHLGESERIAISNHLSELERRPADIAAFLERMVHLLKNRNVYLNAPPPALIAMSQTRDQGAFSSESLLVTGGGGKGIVLERGWFDGVRERLGIRHAMLSYAMTEVIAPMPMCSHGKHHIPPYTLAFLLDPQTGACLRREGVKTGQFACVDLLARTYWGGIVSGDKVTIDWDGGCGCGRKGPFVHPEISRYSDDVTGDDKITCATTTDNSVPAMMELLKV